MNNTAENSAIVAGKAAAYGGATGAFVSGLTVSEWGVIGGLLIGMLGWACTQYWSWRKDRRERAADRRKKAESELRISLMRASGRPVQPQDTETGELEEL